MTEQQPEIIKKRLKIIEDLQNELKILTEQHSDALENNHAYQEAEEKLSEIKATVKEAKDRVVTTPAMTALKKELQEKRTEIKENKEILSQELADYYAESGSLEIEDHTGKTRRLKFNVQLVN